MFFTSPPAVKPRPAPVMTMAPTAFVRRKPRQRVAQEAAASPATARSVVRGGSASEQRRRLRWFRSGQAWKSPGFCIPVIARPGRAAATFRRRLLPSPTLLAMTRVAGVVGAVTAMAAPVLRRRPCGHSCAVCASFRRVGRTCRLPASALPQLLARLVTRPANEQRRRDRRRLGDAVPCDIEIGAADIDPDPAPPHGLRDSTGRAGANKRIEHQRTGPVAGCAETIQPHQPAPAVSPETARGDGRRALRPPGT